MSEIKWQKGLFRIYILWAVVVVVYFIPKYSDNYKKHYAGPFYDPSPHTVYELRDPKWCDKQAKLREEWAAKEYDADRKAAYLKDAMNYRNPKWCAQEAAELTMAADRRRQNAWANALEDVLPRCLFWVIIPWPAHYILKWVIIWVYRGFRKKS